MLLWSIEEYISFIEKGEKPNDKRAFNALLAPACKLNPAIKEALEDVETLEEVETLEVQMSELEKKASAYKSAEEYATTTAQKLQDNATLINITQTS